NVQCSHGDTLRRGPFSSLTDAYNEGESQRNAALRSVVVFLSLNSYFGLPSHVVLLWNSLRLPLCYADLVIFYPSVVIDAAED
ncbi:hypothetical protein STEG23_031959, partial [Scotinomys teguina]